MSNNMSNDMNNTMSMPANGTPKVSLTIEEKQQLIAKAESEPTYSQSMLAKWATGHFGLYTPLNRTTVSKILLRADEIKNVDPFFLKRYNVTRPQFPALENELVQWIVAIRKQGAGVTGAMIQHEAASIAERHNIPKEKFKCSNGWLERFQHRYREGIETTLRAYADATGTPLSSFGAAPALRKNSSHSSAGKRGSVANAALAHRKSALAGGKRASKKVTMPATMTPLAMPLQMQPMQPMVMLAALQNGSSDEHFADDDVVSAMHAAAAAAAAGTLHATLGTPLGGFVDALKQPHDETQAHSVGQYDVDEAVAQAAAAVAAASEAMGVHNAAPLGGMQSHADALAADAKVFAVPNGVHVNVDSVESDGVTDVKHMFDPVGAVATDATDATDATTHADSMLSASEIAPESHDSGGGSNSVDANMIVTA